jgi:hypothetical protein
LALSRPAESAKDEAVATRRQSRLEDDLARWVAAGLLGAGQADAIREHERGPRPAGPGVVPAAAPSGTRARIPVVAEALGYLGGVLALAGLGLLVGRYWPDMGPGARLALSGGGAIAFLVAGGLVPERADPALARLHGFLWLAATAAIGLFVGVLVADSFDGAVQTVVLASSGSVALVSGALWRGRDRPLQQLTFLGGLVVCAGAAVAQVAHAGPVGLTVWGVGAVLLGSGLRRGTPRTLLTEAVGGCALVVGAVITGSDQWTAFGLVLGAATALGLLALALVPGPAPPRPDRILLAIVGGIGFLTSVPGALGYFSADAGVATGLVVWVAGACLVLLGARRLVRLPLLVEGAGGIALVGGAALTGAQSPGFASLFGIITAVALVALGTLPGQVLLSVFGSLGLLVSVPWAISWFFPGEGRAPLLITISGVLLVLIAVLLTRMGGRFRRELRRPRPV